MQIEDMERFLKVLLWVSLIFSVILICIQSLKVCSCYCFLSIAFLLSLKKNNYFVRFRETWFEIKYSYCSQTLILKRWEGFCLLNLNWELIAQERALIDEDKTWRVISQQRMKLLHLMAMANECNSRLDLLNVPVSI